MCNSTSLGFILEGHQLLRVLFLDRFGDVILHHQCYMHHSSVTEQVMLHCTDPN